MSLESIKAAPDLASRVIAFNGRYATLPETATTATTIHLIHGGEDRVIDWRGRFRPRRRYSRRAAT